jgi:hypothetical protein
MNSGDIYAILWVTLLIVMIVMAFHVHGYQGL